MARVHMDFQTQPNVPEMGSKFDAQKTADILKSINADSVNIFLQCNQGYCYYPTKVATPYFALNSDMYGDMLKACHERGIKVIGYLNVAVNHRLALEHPDWLRCDMDGKSLCKPMDDPFCRTMCINTPYGDWFIKVLEEALEMYPETDGIFADNLYDIPCTCPSCTKEMTEAGIDVKDENAVRAFARRKALQYAKKLREICNRTKDRVLDIKGLSQRDIANTSDIEYVPILPVADGYDTYAPNAIYAKGVAKNPSYLDGRFNLGWGDFGGVRSGYEMYSDVCDSLLYANDFCLGDHVHPFGELDEKMYLSYKDAFELSARYYPLLSRAKRIFDIAVLTNEGNVTKEVKACVRMLHEGHYLCDVIDECSDFSSYQMIVLPDGFCMNEQTAKKLKEYNGSVLSCGHASILNGKFALENWECDYCGEDPSKAAYFEFESRAVSEYYPDILMKAKQSISLHIEPYNEKGSKDNRPYFYTPNKGSDGYDAASCNEKYAHISFDIFRAYSDYLSEDYMKLVFGIIERLGVKKSVESFDLPYNCRISLFEEGNDKYLLLKTFINGKMESMSVLPSDCYLTLNGSCSGIEAMESQKKPVFENNKNKITFSPLSGLGFELYRISK